MPGSTFGQPLSIVSLNRPLDKKIRKVHSRYVPVSADVTDFGGQGGVSRLKQYETIAWWLVVVGAVNWGLYGLGMLLGGASWNLVSMLFGPWPMVESVVYVLVGLSGLMLLMGKTGK